MASEKTPDRLLRIPEVAARLGVHRSTVYDLIADQRIPVHLLQTAKGAIQRVSELDLADYIKSTKVAPLQPRRRAA